MKIITSVIILLLFSCSFAISQTNSVVLKNPGGTVISQHSSIKSAYDSIPSTVTQAYIIEILTAYTGANEIFPITLGIKNGTSPLNTITIRPAAGNTGEVISSNSTTGIINIDGADFIILDGRPGGTGTTPDLKIENLASSGTNSNTITLLNGASYNIIRYVHMVNNTQNSAGPRTIEISTSTSTGNSNNLIKYCKIEGGRSGIGLAGSSTVPNDSNTISNCEIFNWGYAGIWLLSGTLNINIDSNKIYQTVGVNNTIVSGIIMSTVAGSNYNLRKNWIYDLQSTSTSTSTAIRGIYSASPAAGSFINIQNNMISIGLDNLSAQTHTGIELLGSNAYTANVYYNTAKIGGNHTGGTSGATTSAGIRIGASALTLNMKNNIAINTRTGGNVNHIGFALTSLTGTLNINYNCYFANGTNAFNAYWGTTGYNTLSDYKTAATPNEQNTIFQNVNFVSSTNLHLFGASIGDVNLKGTPITGITTDFDNDLRNTVAPYKGADEGSVPLKSKENNLVIDDYKLFQNYPNPFNPITKIRFTLREEGRGKKEETRLIIYDILGKEVLVLVNERLSPGMYEVTFDGSGLASGIYFYQLKTENFIETKKLVLLK